MYQEKYSHMTTHASKTHGLFESLVYKSFSRKHQKSIRVNE